MVIYESRLELARLLFADFEPPVLVVAKTPQLAALHEDLWDIVDSNAQGGDKAKALTRIGEAWPLQWQMVSNALTHNALRSRNRAHDLSEEINCCGGELR